MEVRGFVSILKWLCYIYKIVAWLGKEAQYSIRLHVSSKGGGEA